MHGSLVAVLLLAFSSLCWGSDSSEHIWVWEDPSGEASDDYVVTNKQLLFKQRQERYVGLSHAVWWLYLPEATALNEAAYILLKLERLLEVDLVIAQGNEVSVVHSGTRIPLVERPLSISPIAFDVPAATADTDYFLKIRSVGDVVTLDYQLTDANGLSAAIEASAARYYSAISIVVLLILINFTNFVKTREKPFVFYSFYLCSILLIAMERFGGFSRLDLPPRLVDSNPVAVFVALSYTFFALTLLSLFKEIRSLWFRLPLLVGIAMYMLFIAVTFIDLHVAYLLYARGIGTLSVLLITMSLMYGTVTRAPFAALALFGWSFAILGAALSLLFTRGLLPAEFSGVITLGFIAEGIVFTLMLAAQHRHSIELAHYEKSRAAELIRASQLALIGERLATISHEMKQPLNAIRLILANIKHQAQQKPELLAQSVPIKVTRVDQMLDRVIELCDFVRRSSRTASQDEHRADIADSVTGCLVMFDREFTLQGIDFRYAVPSDLPQVSIEQIHLDQIMINLIGNARDAISDSDSVQRWIALEAHCTDEQFVEVRLEDSAGGISDELLARVFEKFFTTKNAEKGTGIGLAVCKQLAEEANGTLTVRNTQNGAQFCLTLPAAPQADGVAHD